MKIDKKQEAKQYLQRVYRSYMEKNPLLKHIPRYQMLTNEQMLVSNEMRLFILDK